MAYQDSVIFQRTESGIAAIRTSKEVLRHNERLVLVLIDGVNTYGALRTKLRGLAGERFDRALEGLQEKGLIVEILFPLIDKRKDAIHPDVLVDFIKKNSDAQSDAFADGGRAHMTDGDENEQVFSGMISDNANIGLSVNTKTGVASQLSSATYLRQTGNAGSDEVDFYLPVDVSLGAVAISSRTKTKLVNVHPQPERRKRKKSKRPVIVQIGWHIYVYYGLLALGVLLVLYAVFVKSFR
ncbi:MAG: hypothetical protein Q7T62_15840 [Undibacterium sp.]|nr:hypothetical protein [Undibacterium sp.]